MYDVVIVGAGPAGMTAAVYAARKKLETVVVSKDVGGQTNWTNDIENYMGYQFIEGPELIRKFENQVKQFPVDFRIGEGVTRVAKIESGFEARTESGSTYGGRACILASGKQAKTLDVPGEDRFRGRGVSYCSTCDAPLFSDMDVAVIGGGNSALEAAIELSVIAKHVYMISLTPLTGDRILIDRVRSKGNVSILTDHETLEIVGEKFVAGIRIRDRVRKTERTVPVEGVFVEIGLVPNSLLAADLVARNALGEIVVTCSCETSTPGLYAAGDVTNAPEKQIVVAAGDGAKAALQAYRYLLTIGLAIPEP